MIIEFNHLDVVGKYDDSILAIADDLKYTLSMMMIHTTAYDYSKIGLWKYNIINRPKIFKYYV